MREITSTKNEIIKLDTQLNEKKHRDKLGLFIVEGIKLITEANKADYELIRTYVNSTELYKYSDALANINCNDIIVTSDSVLNKLTDAKSNQGVVAVVKKRTTNYENKHKRALILENLQDPKNVGALIRSACATDFTDVYLIDCADPWSAKSVRSSMSGIFKVNLHFGSLECVVDSLNGYQILCGDMDGENVFTADINVEGVAIAVGNEGNGVTDKLVKLSTKTVKIPMENGLESLNVAVSGSILMYDIARRIM